MEAKKSLKAVAACALSVAMLFAGAACGTSDGSDDAASSDSGSKASELTGYDVSSVQKDDDIAKLLPDYVTKDGKLTIGMDTSYAPAEFLAADGKTPVGFDVDIAKALAGVFGLEADPETANFDSIIPAVGAKYDIGISSFTVTKERLEAVDFVSHFNAGSAWAVKKGNPNKVDTSDLCGKKVAVQTATMQETAANKMAKQCKADGKAEMDVISSKLQTDVTTNVVTGKADVRRFAGRRLRDRADRRRTRNAWQDRRHRPGRHRRQEGRPADGRGPAEGPAEAHRRRHLHEDPQVLGCSGRCHQQAGDQHPRHQRVNVSELLRPLIRS